MCNFMIANVPNFWRLNNNVLPFPESIKSTGALHYNSSSLTKSYNTKHAKKKLNKKASLFDKLTDEVIGKIFSFFTADELVASAPKVCKRWYSVIWTSPVIWNKITFSDVHYINIDQGLKSILKCLTKGQNVFSSESNSDENLYLNFYSLKRTNSSQLVATNCSTENLASNSDSVSSSTSASSMVEVIKINSMGNSSTLTDRGLMYIARKCSELQSLVIFSSTGITDLGLSEVLSRCNKLHKLDLTGEHFPSLPPPGWWFSNTLKIWNSSPSLENNLKRIFQNLILIISPSFNQL